MSNLANPLHDLATLKSVKTRSICAENPTGARSAGAQASPGEDEHCTDAARELGKGWKVRPCLKNIAAGQTVRLAQINGPAAIQHIWCTVDAKFINDITLRAYYDDSQQPAIDAPLGHFFANGLDGLAMVNSIPVTVNPRGGMNCYWPMPFNKSMRIDIINNSSQTINEFFFQITYALGEIADDVGYFHAQSHQATTSRECPEHVILETIKGQGHYIGTYLLWAQYDPGWWGEGEVKFFIDGDPKDGPTICGTGTEDYFGGAWGFIGADPDDHTPVPYSSAFLGYPQAGIKKLMPDDRDALLHSLYRWHLPDPIHFKQDIKITVQALGWKENKTYLPLADDLASVAFWYQSPLV